MPIRVHQWNRGAYLVEGLAHCGLCHTPKNVAGGDETSRRLQAVTRPGLVRAGHHQRQSAGSRQLVGRRDRDLSQDGAQSDVTAASGPMAEVVMDSTSKITTTDVHAIAEYLKDQPAPTRRKRQSTPDAGVMKLRRRNLRRPMRRVPCAGRERVEGLFPTLKGSPSVQSVDPASLLHVVLRGARSAATDPAPTAPAMPSFGWLLTDDQVAAVSLTFAMPGATAAAVDAATVNKTRHALERAQRLR